MLLEVIVEVHDVSLNLLLILIQDAKNCTVLTFLLVNVGVVANILITMTLVQVVRKLNLAFSRMPSS